MMHRIFAPSKTLTIDLGGSSIPIDKGFILSHDLLSEWPAQIFIFIYFFPSTLWRP